MSSSNNSLTNFRTMKDNIYSLIEQLIDKELYELSRIKWKDNMNEEEFIIFIEEYIKLINYCNTYFSEIIKIHKNILYIRFLLKIFISTKLTIDIYNDPIKSIINNNLLNNEDIKTIISNLEQNFFLTPYLNNI